jgi:titin
VDYTVLYRSAANNTWYNANEEINTTTNVSRLALADETEYKIIAVNANGAGTPLVKTIYTSKVPTAPTNLQFNISGDNIVVSWNAANGYNDAITGYQLQYATQNDYADGADVTLSSATSLTGSIAKPTTASGYYFRVRATNDIGTGVWASSLFVSIDAPGAPTLSSLTAAYKQITANWTQALAGNLPITKYVLDYADNASFNNSTAVDVTYSAGNKAQAVTGLVNETYYFRVKAVNSVGDGPWSNTLSGTPGLGAKPTVTISAAQTNDNGVTNIALTGGGTGGYVKGGYKLYISGNITDADVESWAVSYSLSASTTPGTWTVCRSASSTRKYVVKADCGLWSKANVTT